MRLSQKKIALLWISEGGDPHRADEASAISMAESGGNSKAGNSCCHGIYQFNVEVGVTSMKCALNTVCATRKAISMSKNGQDWSPWEAYTNGAYQQFLGKSGVGDGKKYTKLRGQKTSFDFHGALPEGPAAEKLLESGVLGEAAEDVLGTDANALGLGGVFEAVKGINAFFVGLGELILTPEGWLRLAKLLVGAYLSLKGLNIIIRGSTGIDAAKAAKQSVTKAAETAAVVATVK